MGIDNLPLPTARRPTLTGRLIISVVFAALCGFAVGLAVSRLLFEGLFPAAAWLGRPMAALALGALGGGAAGFMARRGSMRPIVLLPLLLNLLWLVDPTVDPTRSRFLFGAGVWAAAVLGVWTVFGDADRRWRWVGPLLVVAGLLPVYLSTMSHAVGAADTFEFQVVASQLGIAHPTGYPLYLLLGKLFSLLPASTVAWRLNLASAVYAVLAAAVVFRIGWRLTGRPLAAAVGATVLGLTPVYWGQAIVAEVYTLHALFVATALWLMVRLIAADWPLIADRAQGSREISSVAVRRSSAVDRKTMVALAFVLGLGLTNHLTTVFLLPPAALAMTLHLWPMLRRRGDTSRRRSLLPLLLQLSIAFALPLLLYAYLPIRWVAVNGEPMGLGRFVEWVIGGRFQGALQWGAWLRDPARREIVGRLLLETWGWVYLIAAAVGLVWLFAREWRAALVLLVTAAGFTFYALNYYVPDLAVFLIPTHVVIAVWVAAGIGGVAAELRAWEIGRLRDRAMFGVIEPVVFTLVLLPALTGAGDRWSTIDQSGRDGGESWARGVLGLTPARGAAILADSEKIASLYYLQQIEGLRRDLDIMVLPDEAAYRAELDARLAAGQPVYLARYLPGLEGIYHLRSAGPLVEVSREPLAALPADAIPTEEVVGPLRLLGYRLEPVAAVDSDAAALTLYWTLDRPLRAGERSPVVYLRWAGGEPAVAGLHPAGDVYPVNAWRPGEVVPDYHLLPLPDAQPEANEESAEWAIEVAAAPRFTPAAELDWQPVAAVPARPRPGPVGAPRRALFDGFALDGVDFPAVVRPGTPLPLRYSGHGDGEQLTFLLVPPHAVNSLIIPTDRAPARQAATGSMTFAATVEPAAEAGPHVLIAYVIGEAGAVCGWLASPTTGCVVGEMEARGAPLPEGAINFADQIALLDATIDNKGFAPGGQLPVTLTWQGLAEMNADYTVFVQVLDAADRIVGQVDAWPVQGTRPTSTLRPGETITDPYVVQLSPDLPPGDYRLHVGLYLLATGQRLPIVDETGQAVDDKVEMIVVGR